MKLGCFSVGNMVGVGGAFSSRGGQGYVHLHSKNMSECLLHRMVPSGKNQLLVVLFEIGGAGLFPHLSMFKKAAMPSCRKGNLPASILRRP